MPNVLGREVASMEWIGEVLTNEFFWGVVVGVVLTGIGAWLFAIWRQRGPDQELLYRVWY
jgi:hypothetical protein